MGAENKKLVQEIQALHEEEEAWKRDRQEARKLKDVRREWLVGACEARVAGRGM